MNSLIELASFRVGVGEKVIPFFLVKNLCDPQYLSLTRPVCLKIFHKRSVYATILYDLVRYTIPYLHVLIMEVDVVACPNSVIDYCATCDKQQTEVKNYQIDVRE